MGVSGKCYPAAALIYLDLSIHASKGPSSHDTVPDTIDGRERNCHADSPKGFCALYTPPLHPPPPPQV